jgi:hypothetical protein
MLFAKNEKANLSAADRTKVKRIVEAFRDRLMKRGK